MNEKLSKAGFELSKDCTSLGRRKIRIRTAPLEQSRAIA
jgi:hypothetical protein